MKKYLLEDEKNNLSLRGNFILFSDLSIGNNRIINAKISIERDLIKAGKLMLKAKIIIPKTNKPSFFITIAWIEFNANIIHFDFYMYICRLNYYQTKLNYINNLSTLLLIKFTSKRVDVIDLAVVDRSLYTTIYHILAGLY